MSLPHDQSIERETDAIECRCGGFAPRVRATDAEKDKYGCGRDHLYECCVRAFVCKVCGERYATTAPAPEME